jgi:hypothetical protein
VDDVQDSIMLLMIITGFMLGVLFDRFVLIPMVRFWNRWARG